MSQSKNTRHVFGSIDVLNYTNLKNTRITGIANPILDTDGANKGYVDSKVVASNLTGGVGITVNTSNNTINSNSSATHITAIGTIQAGTWTANTIQIPYGGTGQTAFTVNKLIYHNSANRLASIAEFTYDSNTFNSTLPFVISNTTDTFNTLSSTGSLIIGGGVNIAKSVYIGGDVRVNANLTVGNLTINGSLSLNSINSNTSQFTTSTITSLSTSTANITGYLTSNSTNSINLVSTNNTFTNTIITTNTVSNSLVNGTLNVPSLGIFGTINSTFITCGSFIGLSSNVINLNATTATTANLRNTNATIQNLRISTLLNSTNAELSILTNTQGILTNITNSNLINSNLISTNSSINNLINVNLTSTNITSNYGYINTISAGTIQVSNFISIPNITSNNIVTNNLSSVNVVFTNISTGTLNINGASNMSTLNLTTITVSNIRLDNMLTSNLNNLSITTIGTLQVTGLSTFSTINSISISTSSLNSINISTDTLNSNILVNTTSSIGTLNVSGDINNSSGTIYTNNITSNNLYSSTLLNTPNIITTNITTAYLRSSGISIQGTVLSTNLSTGFINSNSITTSNLNNTFCTLSNCRTINQTTTNLRATYSTATNILLTSLTGTNLFVTNETISSMLISKNINLISNYQGAPFTTIGSFLTIYPSTFTNNITASGGSVNNWYANYIGSATLSATNTGIVTNMAANLYIKSNVILGGNQSILYNSAMTIGYVNNVTGGNMNTQLNFERSDGTPLGGIYTESITNKLVFINGSLSGGGGIGIYTVKDTPVVYSNIPNSTNITPTPYIQLLNTTSTFYSTVDSDSMTTGSLILQGGLGVSKTITTNIVKASSFESNNSTISNLYINGLLTQPGYGLFSLTTTSFPTSESNIEFSTIANLSNGVTITVQPFVISGSTIMENVLKFTYPGIYNINLQLNVTTTTTSATLIQTHINKFDGSQWQQQQTSSLKTIFESSSDIYSNFMIQVQANEYLKLTLYNGHFTNFTFDSDSKKSRLMVNKIG